MKNIEKKFFVLTPVIILENVKILEVNKEQFDKAVEGNECRTIFH